MSLQGIYTMWALILVALVAAYLYLTRHFGYWSKRNIHHGKPVPFFGSLLKVMTFRTTVGEMFVEAYRSVAEDDQYVGMWAFDRPALVLRHPDPIKSVLVKDFHRFNDRSLYSDVVDDPLGGNSLFSVKNPHWRLMRTKLSPVFTSSKMRAMFGLTVKAAEDLDAHCQELIASGQADDVEMREVCAKFATDSIASVAYGVEANSFRDPQALFRTIGRKIFDFDVRRGLELTSVFFAPQVAKLFKFKFFSSDCSDTLRKVFWDIIHAREAKPIQRHDLIDVLIQLKNEDYKEGEIKLEGDALVAQAAVFFTGGFDTSSNTMSFLLYYMAKNPGIQERLNAEIVETIRKYDGAITYDCIQDMKYLEMCIKETLRMIPPLPFLDRMCNGKYNLPNTDGVSIDDGVIVYIPVLALHMDPRHFPQPDVYDPERFSEENIGKIKPFTYMPFGDGPRNCIGERFGMLQTKVGITSLLRKYRVCCGPSTYDIMEFDRKSLLTKPKNGMRLKLERR